MIKKDLIYTEYDNTCMIYLSVSILRKFELEKKWLYMDAYCNAIKDIYKDFRKSDNIDLSLLDSIEEYIDANEFDLREKIKPALSGFI